MGETDGEVLEGEVPEGEVLVGWTGRELERSLGLGAGAKEPPETLLGRGLAAGREEPPETLFDHGAGAGTEGWLEKSGW